MTTTCDPNSLLPFNNNNVCTSCGTIFPNCRTCTQTTPTSTTCSMCKIPFTGESCERDCGQGYAQLNKANCQPYSAAYPIGPQNVCTDSTHGSLSTPDVNGDVVCVCNSDKKDPRHYDGPNCDRRREGLNCNGTIMLVCDKCDLKTCKTCPPGTTSQDKKQGCCNNGCATCSLTNGAIYDIVPFPPSVCLSCDPDSIRSVLKGTDCIACEDAIDGCSSCTQIEGQDAECISCRGRLTGSKCDKECQIDQIQYNINFCQSDSCISDAQCNGNGSCKPIDDNFQCVCNEGFSGENCTENSFECVIDNCRTCSAPNICQFCQPQFKLSENTCIASSCQEIFPNCETCENTIPPLTCTKCTGNFTGLSCETTCQYNYVQFNITNCQNASCDTDSPCSGSGKCSTSETGDNECVCDSGKSGLNCENDCDSNCLTCGQVHTECTSCKIDTFLLNKKCITCDDLPYCYGCAQTSPTDPITCLECNSNYTGVSCDRQCPEGQLQYNTNFCQSASCFKGYVVCNENGTCQLKDGNFLCDCIEGAEGSNCETTTSGMSCSGGPFIEKCVKCRENTQQCSKCFKGAVSEDKLACCDEICHACTTDDPSHCIGCDKKSERPFYYNAQCLNCQEIYPNCTSCQQGGFFTKVFCLECSIGYTGDSCDQKCELGFVKYGVFGCQPASCDSHLPCSGDGTCEPNGDNLMCKCFAGATGINCEHRPPCSVSNCELCSISSSSVCKMCKKDYMLSDEKCVAVGCLESIKNCNMGCLGGPGDYTCQTCQTPYTGNQCDVSCGEGFGQLNKAHCQSLTCSASVECNGNGQCGVLDSGHKICDCNKYFSGPNCENNCSEPCKTCDKADRSVCLSCYGQDVIHNKTCTNCAKLFPNCETCSSEAPLTCTKCKPQYVTADCSVMCEPGTEPYRDVGCKPVSCSSPLPCNGQSDCEVSGNDVKCTCNKHTSGPNCEIHIGDGQTCDGTYKIEKCVLCSGGTPNVCAFCAKDTVMNTPHTECCHEHCADCDMGTPKVCTECSGRHRPYLVDGKCVSCSTIPHCDKCYQASTKSPLQCDKCVSTFTGLQCEKDCGQGRKQYNSSDCQSSSCTFPNQCDGNGFCQETSGNKYCRCQTGFSGENCENQQCKVQNCQECHFNDPETCQICFNDLNESTNCQDCKKGYYQMGNQCEKCGAFCNSCDVDGCLECYEGKVIIDGECKDEVKIPPSNKLSTGGIIGIVVAILLILAVVIIVIIVVIKKRKGGNKNGKKDRQLAVFNNADNQVY